MAGMDSAPGTLTLKCDSKTFADELNAFYGRFDVHNESNKIRNIQRTLRSQLGKAPTLTEEDVKTASLNRSAGNQQVLIIFQHE